MQAINVFTVENASYRQIYAKELRLTKVIRAAMDLHIFLREIYYSAARQQVEV